MLTFSFTTNNEIVIVTMEELKFILFDREQDFYNKRKINIKCFNRKTKEIYLFQSK